MDILAADFLEYSDSYSGMCIKCKAIQDGGCEPDAEGYKCLECGANSVMGIENALLMGHVNIK